VDTAIPLLRKRYAGPHSDHRDKTIGNFIPSEYASGAHSGYGDTLIT
jgi:hypothetical protein